MNFFETDDVSMSTKNGWLQNGFKTYRDFKGHSHDDHHQQQHHQDVQPSMEENQQNNKNVSNSTISITLQQSRLRNLSNSSNVSNDSFSSSSSLDIGHNHYHQVAGLVPKRPEDFPQPYYSSSDDDDNDYHKSFQDDQQKEPFKEVTVNHDDVNIISLTSSKTELKNVISPKSTRSKRSSRAFISNSRNVINTRNISKTVQSNILQGNKNLRLSFSATTKETSRISERINTRRKTADKDLRLKKPTARINVKQKQSASLLPNNNRSTLSLLPIKKIVTKVAKSSQPTKKNKTKRPRKSPNTKIISLSSSPRLSSTSKKSLKINVKVSSPTLPLNPTNPTIVFSSKKLLIKKIDNKSSPISYKRESISNVDSNNNNKPKTTFKNHDHQDSKYSEKSPSRTSARKRQPSAIMMDKDLVMPDWTKSLIINITQSINQ